MRYIDILSPWILSAAFLFGIYLPGKAQVNQDQKPEINARNGWYITPKDRIHVMVVFAELEFDSTFSHMNPVKKEGYWRWKAGQMPLWKNDLFSGGPEGDGLMTKYFRQASFGNFQVTGDYLNTLITVKLSEVVNQNGNVVTQEAFGNNFYKRAVLRKVNGLEEPGFGFGSALEDFDRRTFHGVGQPNTMSPNGRIDLVMVIWRNIHVAYLGDGSGFVSPGSLGNVLGMESDMYSIMRASDGLPDVLCRHEFSHMLYGGNNFHTANGGVGTRMFLPTVGGWSNMSASDAASKTWNGWDRERMGWLSPESPYVVHAVDEATGESVNASLNYGDALPAEGVFRLRDFVSTGDAIKIKLPHLPDGVRNQYLWLENHQSLPGNYDLDKEDATGLHAYLQVGKDVMEGKQTFGDNCNYLWPMVAHGNYDFQLGGERNRVLKLDKERANPFTGYHYLARIVFDKNEDHKIRVTSDNGTRTEYVLPADLVCDGDTVDDQFCSYEDYPMFGTQLLPYRMDGYRRIGIDENPAPVPVYTHGNHRAPTKKDNRRIYLNGISVELIGQDFDGSMLVRVRWDDFAVRKDVRWCGDIHLVEQLELARGRSITLDQGYSTQVTTAVQQIAGKDVFALPTEMTLRSGSVTTLDKHAKICVAAGSGLVIESGAVVEMDDFAAILVESGAYIRIEDGAVINTTRRSEGIQRQEGALEGRHPLLMAQLAPTKRELMNGKKSN